MAKQNKPLSCKRYANAQQAHINLFLGIQLVPDNYCNLRGTLPGLADSQQVTGLSDCWEKDSELLFSQCDFHSGFSTFSTKGLCLIMTVKLKSSWTFQNLPQISFHFPHIWLWSDIGAHPIPCSSWATEQNAVWPELDPHHSTPTRFAKSNENVTMATKCHRHFTKCLVYILPSKSSQNKSMNNWIGLNETKRKHHSGLLKKTTFDPPNQQRSQQNSPSINHI